MKTPSIAAIAFAAAAASAAAQTTVCQLNPHDASCIADDGSGAIVHAQGNTAVVQELQPGDRPVHIHSDRFGNTYVRKGDGSSTTVHHSAATGDTYVKDSAGRSRKCHTSSATGDTYCD